MPDIDAWAGDSFPLSAWSDDVDQGVDLARIISDKSASITILRDGAALDAQSMRIEEWRIERELLTPGGITMQVDAIAIGYKGHPTITDTDIQPGDRFKYNGQFYEVLITVPGLTDGVQAYLKVKQ